MSITTTADHPVKIIARCDHTEALHVEYLHPDGGTNERVYALGILRATGGAAEVRATFEAAPLRGCACSVACDFCDGGNVRRAEYSRQDTHRVEYACTAHVAAHPANDWALMQRKGAGR